MYTSHSVLTSACTRNNDPVLQTVFSWRSEAARALASEEFHQSAIAEAARRRLAREAGIKPPGAGSPIAMMRRLVDAVLHQFGKRPRGGMTGSIAIGARPSA